MEMRISPIAYACFLLPCAVIVACYLVSLHTVPDFPVCFPFFSGCISISAAARQDPSIHLFRMVMLPMTTVIAGFWLMARSWLLWLGGRRADANAVGVLGLVGALFLVLYVVFLGTDGQVYSLLRRFGTTLYFGCTGIAQLLLAVHLVKRRKDLPPALPAPLLYVILTICVSMLVMGIVYIPAAHAFQASNIENIIEWNFATLMQINFGLFSIFWRRQNITLSLDFGTPTHEPSS